MFVNDAVNIFVYKLVFILIQKSESFALFKDWVMKQCIVYIYKIQNFYIEIQSDSACEQFEIQSN